MQERASDVNEWHIYSLVRTALPMAARRARVQVLSSCEAGCVIVVVVVVAIAPRAMPVTTWARHA